MFEAKSVVPLNKRMFPLRSKVSRVFVPVGLSHELPNFNAPESEGSIPIVHPPKPAISMEKIGAPPPETTRVAINEFLPEVELRA